MLQTLDLNLLLLLVSFMANATPDVSGTAVVPGGIYSDLLENGILSQDPLTGDLDVEYRYVSKVDWMYEKTFTLPDDVLSKPSIFLVLHGVDTVANISINDAFIGSTDNMFVRYKFNIKQSLRQPGDRDQANKLTIAFESPVHYAKSKYLDHVREKGYIVPPVCANESQRGECHPNFIRKMQCSFSWDWGPAFPSIGVWKSVHVEAVEIAALRSVQASTIYNDVTKRWSIDTQAIIESRSGVTITIDYYLDDKQIGSVSTTRSASAEIIYKIGRQLNLDFDVELWWPNGVHFHTEQGRVQKLDRRLYTLKTVAKVAEGEHADVLVKEVRIGFREIELVQIPINPDGYTFYFKVNSHVMFMKGSNYIPSSVFPEKMTNDTIRDLLLSAAEANQNMIRVWGGQLFAFLPKCLL